MEFDEKAAKVIFSNEKTTLFLFTGKNADKSKFFRATLDEASSQLKGKVVLSYLNITEGQGPKLGEYLGVEEKDTPKFIMIKFVSK